MLEISAFAASLVILDAMEKAAAVRLLQAELNDYYGFVLKITGDPASLQAAVQQAETTAGRMHAPIRTALLQAPDDRAMRAIYSKPEYQPLIEQEVVLFPKEKTMRTAPPAIGLIETQGFTAAIQAIDTACKAADVEVIGKEKLGGGYITILIAGDTAAIEVAVAAGRAKVDALGKLIAAHVITRPSDSILRLLPE